MGKHVKTANAMTACARGLGLAAVLMAAGAGGAAAQDTKTMVIKTRHRDAQ